MRIVEKDSVKRTTFLKCFLTSKGFRAVYFYRAVNHRNDRRSRFLFVLLRELMTDIHISSAATIGGGFMIPHPQCIVIGGATIGENVTVQQGVTIGANIDKTDGARKYPIIHDNVLIGAGAKVLGPLTIGGNSIIGANSVVINDVPERSVAAGVPARVVGPNRLDYLEFLEDELQKRPQRR